MVGSNLRALIARIRAAEAGAKEKDTLIRELTRNQQRIRDLLKGYDPDNNEDERFCRDCADSDDGRCVNGGGGFCDPQRDAEHRVAKLRAAEAERDRLREALRWKPIETAPKDGTFIITKPKSDKWVPAQVLAWKGAQQQDGTTLWSWTDVSGRYAWNASVWMEIPPRAALESTNAE